MPACSSPARIWRSELKRRRKIAVAIAGRSCSTKDALNLLADRLAALPRHVYQKQRVALGTYRGLAFGIVLNPQWSNEVYVEGAITRLDTLSRDSQGPRAVMNAVERIAGGYAAERETTKRNLTVAETQLQDY